MTRQSNVSSQRAEGGRKLPQAATQGLVRVSAGELLGRTHEELVLLLIQLRRQNATIYKAMENCHMEIEAQVRRHFQKQNRWANGSSCDWEQWSLRRPVASWLVSFFSLRRRDRLPSVAKNRFREKLFSQKEILVVTR